MTNIDKSIKNIEAKLCELNARAKLEKDEQSLKNTSLKHNILVIDNLYLKKKETLFPPKGYNYDEKGSSHGTRKTRFTDQDNIPFMEAIVNSLNNINDRLEKLETYNDNN